MNEIIKTLMERDNMTEEEATKHFRYVNKLIDDSNYNYEEIEDIMSIELGLEMDYIDFII